MQRKLSLFVVTFLSFLLVVSLSFGYDIISDEKDSTTEMITSIDKEVYSEKEVITSSEIDSTRDSLVIKRRVCNPTIYKYDDGKRSLNASECSDDIQELDFKPLDKVDVVVKKNIMGFEHEIHIKRNSFNLTRENFDKFRVRR